MAENLAALESEVKRFRQGVDRLSSALSEVIAGQDAVIEHVLCALLAGGHVLLEGAPGLGKTLLVRTLASAIDLSFSRVQFTPDLMPADITGTNVVVENTEGGRHFRFQKGPIFAHLVLADEINRTTPKTQSALLEAMQEGGVTVAGQLHPLPDPFMVLATQNPIEMEGTYPLPEAQLDRFILKVLVPYPGAADLAKVVDRTTGRDMPTVSKVLSASDVVRFRALAREVVVAPVVRDLAVNLILATHPTNPKAPDEVRRFVRYGSSPRGAQALITCSKVRALRLGRAHADVSDVRALIPATLRHRLILNFEGEAEGLTTDRILESVGAAVR
jgi:MoxR-like ATPase